METYALVGPSGTGKSHKAQAIAYKFNIPLIIDDGLLIWKDKILAGKSAKREKNKISAIKTSIFTEEGHRIEVKQGIKFSGEDKLLILGTSIRMVEKIRERLDLPEIKKTIMIEDISTYREISKARHIRKRYHKHVIPVPRIEIESSLGVPGYLIETFKFFLNTKDEEANLESTIVRPNFSYNGKLIISDKVLKELVHYKTREDKHIAQLLKLDLEDSRKGVVFNLELKLTYGNSITEVIQQYQRGIKKEIEDVTGINVLAVNVLVNSLAL